MAQDKTVAHLFELAIEAERVAEELYRTLARKFAPYPGVVQFWTRMGAEEVAHAKALERIRDGLPAETLAETADPRVLSDAQTALYLGLDRALPHVTNLQEAYQLVSDLENSETNAVFEFLVSTFPADEKTATFLRNQLRDHVMRLMTDFPERFGPADVRRQMPATE